MTDSAGSRQARRVWLQPKSVGAVILTVLVIVFIAQNREKGTIEFLFLDLDVGIWLGLAVTFVLGVAVGWLIRRSRAK